MPACRVKGCPHEAGDYVVIRIPNTRTENYDRVNPVKVPVCVIHAREIASPLTVSLRAFDL